MFEGGGLGLESPSYVEWGLVWRASEAWRGCDARRLSWCAGLVCLRRGSGWKARATLSGGWSGVRLERGAVATRGGRAGVFEGSARAGKPELRAGGPPGASV